MTYTEFIIGVENNIAKANCNKLNMEEYEEKQKQIYKQIIADAIDDFANWLVEQGILGNRCISDGEITDYGKVYAKKYTAYNIDKVVEELYEERTEILLSNDYECEIINYCIDNFDKAIEIIKHGGIRKDV